MSEKIIGYTLLSLGIILILVALYSVYGVFTNRFNPVQVFSFESVGLDTAAFVPQEFVGQVTPSKQKSEILSADILNETSNVFAHVVFMGFVAGAGQKIASIGAQLVRPIKIKTTSA